MDYGHGAVSSRALRLRVLDDLFGGDAAVQQQQRGVLLKLRIERVVAGLRVERCRNVPSWKRTMF